MQSHPKEVPPIKIWKKCLGDARELNSYLGARRQGCRTTQPYAVEPMILIGGLQQNAFCQKKTKMGFQ